MMLTKFSKDNRDPAQKGLMTWWGHNQWQVRNANRIRVTMVTQDTMINVEEVVRNQHIGVWTKWPPFCSWHFQMHILEWKSSYFDENVNTSLSVQIVAWCQIGDKPLPEPLATNISSYRASLGLIHWYLFNFRTQFNIQMCIKLYLSSWPFLYMLHSFEEK